MPETLIKRPIVSRAEWIAARQSLLAQEEAVAAAQRQVTAQRAQMPFVEVTKDYRLFGPDGSVSLLDLFDGRDQLIVYHFMFAPEWEAGCKYCSSMVDNMEHAEHLNAHNTTLVLVSRAPIDKILPFRERMGWNLPWYSSYESDFNYDFYGSLTDDSDPLGYVYIDKATLEAEGIDYWKSGEQGGSSVFFRDGDRIFHTYSTFGPGSEQLDGIFNYLDLTPLGRQDSANLDYHDRYQR